MIALVAAASSAAAQERMYFPAVDNVTNVLVEKINAEPARIDMSAWYLTERSISIALVNRFKAGVQVRLMGDRAAMFEIDPKVKEEFYWLASQGVPIRLRYHPTWFPEIVHWKATIFVGQNLVEFGSANYTPFELAPVSSTNYKDETALFTDDPELVNAFKTQFDRMWNDTTAEPHSRVSPPYYRDWNVACALEPACADYSTKYPNPAPMQINTARLEPDYPMPPDMVWGQGPLFNDRQVLEINTEINFIDYVIYRLTVPNITDALLAKHKAGVPVRIIMEPNEYGNRKWPEFWLTHAYMDKLWAAGVPIKKRIHVGLTHMKMLITSRYATNASSNLAEAWQRDTNYFVPAGTKPAIYGAMRNRFNTMWNDPAGFASFTPEPPDAPALASPSSGSTGVSLTPTLTWQRAVFATMYDVYLGTSSGSLSRVATVNAQLTSNPPDTYSWTATTPLQGGTTYYWRVVSRTFASVTATSPTYSFSTSGTASAPPPATGATPYTGTAISLPGIVQAENFDNGGAGVAYRDTTTGNSGGQYRSTDVDIEATSDAGGGYNIGWLDAGEWLVYTVSVPSAGTYSLNLRVAANGAGGRLRVEFNGADKTGPMTIPNTGGWQAWTTISAPVTLAAGTQQMRVVIDAASPANIVGNVNHIEVVASSASTPPPAEPPPASTPYTGTAISLPGTVQAENFDNGGAGVAYRDTTTGNSGGQYRATDVDIEATSDAGGGYNVGWMAAGEWLVYTVSVPSAGTYSLNLRVAANGAGGRLHVEFNGVDKTGAMTIPDTRGWQRWTTITVPVTLAAGTQKMRLVIDAASSAGVVGNINSLSVTTK